MTRHLFPGSDEIRAVERAARLARARAMGRMLSSAVSGVRRAFRGRRRGMAAAQ